MHEETALADLTDGPKTHGPLRCVRAVRGRAYAVGVGRQASVRTGFDSWERIDAGVRTDLRQNQVRGFETPHGVNANSIYAAGRRKEIWRYDGNRWHQEDSPTNRIITDVRCSASGPVFAGGLNGTVLVRSGGAWHLVDHDATEDCFWSVREFAGKVYLATMTALYQLSGDSVTPVNFGRDALATCFTLSVAGNVLWSVGAKNIFSFDGADWARVV